MPSLKFTTALKPLDLIKSIQAGSQTGRVNAAAYGTEAVLQDIDRCVSIGTVCSRSPAQPIYFAVHTSQHAECCPSCALCIFTLAKHGNYMQCLLVDDEYNSNNYRCYCYDLFLMTNCKGKLKTVKMTVHLNRKRRQIHECLTIARHHSKKHVSWRMQNPVTHTGARGLLTLESILIYFAAYFPRLFTQGFECCGQC